MNVTKIRVFNKPLIIVNDTLLSLFSCFIWGKYALLSVVGCCFGALEKIRTSDLALRRRLLYPAELQRRVTYCIVLSG